MHWNCFALKNKINDLEMFINNRKIDIVLLNETKLDNSFTSNINNYEIIRKDRNNRGGGVAIIINNEVDFEIIDSYDSFNLEIISIKVYVNNKEFIIICFYLPPNATFPNEFFKKIEKEKNLIVAGDLNCKSKSWYSRKENKNGKLLDEYLENSNLQIIRNKKPTYFNKANNQMDILDLIITCSNLAPKIINMEIVESELISDHFPIIFNLKNTRIKYEPKEYKRVDIEQEVNIIEESILKTQENNPNNQSTTSLYNNFVNIAHVAKEKSTKIIKKR